jgi:hypothetical protein
VRRSFLGHRECIPRTLENGPAYSEKGRYRNSLLTFMFSLPSVSASSPQIPYYPRRVLSPANYFIPEQRLLCSVGCTDAPLRIVAFIYGPIHWEFRTPCSHFVHKCLSVEGICQLTGVTGPFDVLRRVMLNRPRKISSSE